jgi:hypothetical protein
MQINEFYKLVRVLTRANTRDFPDTEIATLANPEADYLYELSIQGEHLQQTKNQTPTVLSFSNVTADFIPTNHNLWIERVEVSATGENNYTRLARTNDTEYNLHNDNACMCSDESLTDALTSKSCPTSFIQTSEGLRVFPIPAGGLDVKVYIKDTPVINWTSGSYELKIPNVGNQLLALRTALMYRDIEKTGQKETLEAQYAIKFKTFNKRISKGSRIIQMGMVRKSFK